MSESGSSTERLQAELQILRTEVAEMRNEQKEMARSIDQLVTTFRSLAVHLGIASEPYQKGGKSAARSEIPGFA